MYSLILYHPLKTEDEMALLHDFGSPLQRQIQPSHRLLNKTWGVCAGWGVCVMGGRVVEWEEGRMMRGFLRHHYLKYCTTDDPRVPLIWHISSLPCRLSGNFLFFLDSYVRLCFLILCLCSSSVALNLLTKSKLVRRRMEVCSFQRGEGNANLARYRDVPDSQSTISNTLLLLLLHDTTFAESCLFKTNYTGCTFFSTLNVSSNQSMTVYSINHCQLTFLFSKWSPS